MELSKKQNNAVLVAAMAVLVFAIVFVPTAEADCLPIGSACLAGTLCCSQNCNLVHECVCSPVSGPCVSNNDCCVGSTCTLGICRIP
ncbi:hypothetical protein COLO4_27722 [Corchorus olitorius]|uniref:Uncharacterized protein n=1 Tax=Corchorus olitorius TaxID=93759 RepID=A0A1R3HPF0_9ROSI|nr:hypothetical protein COLO4_27722 [Corchorus olitorius]